MYSGIPQNAAPRCVITEEPDTELRYRYASEGSNGLISGTSSTPEHKTYPTIQIRGYKGKAKVIVSCVTEDEPYRPHPHKLGRNKDWIEGVYRAEVPEETMTVSFRDLGFLCVRRRDMADSLTTREELGVDPFNTGFSHRNNVVLIPLNAVRLCFQVYLQEPNRVEVGLDPVVSNPIYDSKGIYELKIIKLSHCVCPVDGGINDIILLCEKVKKDDIKIRFFEKKNNEVVWEGFSEFQPTQVYKQMAIWFRPPQYKKLDVTEPVQMFIQLQSITDRAESEPLQFQMIPLVKRRAEHTENNRSKRMLLTALHELHKNTPLPEMYNTTTMNIPSKQTTIKDNTAPLLEICRSTSWNMPAMQSLVQDVPAPLPQIHRSKSLNIPPIQSIIDEPVPLLDLDDSTTIKISPMQFTKRNKLGLSNFIDSQYQVCQPQNPCPNIPLTSMAQHAQQLPSFGETWERPSTSYDLSRIFIDSQYEVCQPRHPSPNMPSTSAAVHAQQLPPDLEAWSRPSTSYGLAHGNTPMIPITATTSNDLSSSLLYRREVPITNIQSVYQLSSFDASARSDPSVSKPNTAFASVNADNSDNLPYISSVDTFVTNFQTSNITDSLDRLANNEEDGYLALIDLMESSNSF